MVVRAEELSATHVPKINTAFTMKLRWFVILYQLGVYLSRVCSFVYSRGVRSVLGLMCCLENLMDGVGIGSMSKMLMMVDRNASEAYAYIRFPCPSCSAFSTFSGYALGVRCVSPTFCFK